MERKIPLWILAFTLWLGLCFVVASGWLVRQAVLGNETGRLGQAAVNIASFPSMVRVAFKELTGCCSPLFIPNRFPEIDGFLKNDTVQVGATRDNGFILLPSYDKSHEQFTVRLIRINDQKVLYDWKPDVKELERQRTGKKGLFDDRSIKSQRFLMYHPLLLADGSLVFSSPGETLYKIDACSKIEWVADGTFHHAIEKDSDGNIWTGFRIEPSSYDEEIYVDYKDDAIVQISPDGKILFKKSVSKILEENGYRGLLFGVGAYDNDLIHLNDVQPAHYSTDYWEKGDLLISIRNRSTVFLYRKSTDKIVWLRTGPWANQHDADFIGKSQISVFGNDEMRGAKQLFDGHNNIYLYEFSDGNVSTPYSEMLKKLKVQTRSEGVQEILKNGDVFVEESNFGRLLRISPKQAVWEFTVKMDDGTLGLTSGSSYLRKDQVEPVLQTLKSSECA